MTRRLLVLLTPILLTACSNDGPVKDAGGEASGLAYGQECAKDGQCSSNLCVDKVCSKTCKRLAECPAVDGIPYDCGEVTEKEGKIACYPRRAPTVPYTVGHDCSLDLKCAVGFRCMGVTGAADRYCSKTCESDRDCPPRFRCSQVRTGTDLPEPERWCRRRDFCHPCVIDDQCDDQSPPANLCVRDPAGQGFCSKACNPTGGGCAVWAKCMPVGDKAQCKPKTGYCSKTDGGGLCDNCLTYGWVSLTKGDYAIAEVDTCKPTGVCYMLSKATGENICVMPCAADGSCPGPAYWCFTLNSLGAKYCLPSPDQKTFGTCAP